jgi:NADH-quinone oxidoreductase subunit N
MLHNWPVIAPYAILALSGGLIFCLGAFWRRLPEGLLWWIALAASAAAGLCALGGPQKGVYLGLLDAGLYGRGFVLLITLVTLLTLLLLRSYARARSFAGDELYGLVLLAALGMILTAAAVNWLALFLGLQLLSVCLYILTAIRRDSERSLEAGLKYFCLGAAAGAAMLFGTAMLYAAGGSLDIQAGLKAAMAHKHGALALLGLGLLLCGLAFKISLTPLHVWTPDVFQGAPAPITAFLAAGSKTAAAAVLIRLCAVIPRELWPYLDASLVDAGRPDHAGGQYQRPEGAAGQEAAGLFQRRPDGLSANGPYGGESSRSDRGPVLPYGLRPDGSGRVRSAGSALAPGY